MCVCVGGCLGEAGGSSWDVPRGLESGGVVVEGFAPVLIRLPLTLLGLHTYTHTHTHTHTHIHTYMHTYIHTHTCTHQHSIGSNTLTFASKHKHTPHTTHHTQHTQHTHVEF